MQVRCFLFPYLLQYKNIILNYLPPCENDVPGEQPHLTYTIVSSLVPYILTWGLSDPFEMNENHPAPG